MSHIGYGNFCSVDTDVILIFSAVLYDRGLSKRRMGKRVVSAHFFIIVKGFPFFGRRSKQDRAYFGEAPIMFGRLSGPQADSFRGETEV